MNKIHDDVDVCLKTYKLNEKGIKILNDKWNKCLSKTDINNIENSQSYWEFTDESYLGIKDYVMNFLDETCFQIINEITNKCRIIDIDKTFNSYSVIAYKQWNLSNCSITKQEVKIPYLIQKELLGVEYSEYIFKSNYFIVKNHGFNKQINTI